MPPAGQVDGVVQSGDTRPKLRLSVRRRARHDHRVHGRVRGVRRARIRILAYPYGSRRPFARRTRRTDRKGRFTISAPRRQVCVVRAVVTAKGYRPKAVTVRFTGRPTLRVRATRARVGYGDVIELRGRITGDAGANAGRVVAVRAQAGSRWISAGRTVVGPSGAIRWRHQLRHTHRPSDYRLRLVLVRRPSLPWRSLVSPSVTVRVRP